MKKEKKLFLNKIDTFEYCYSQFVTNGYCIFDLKKEYEYELKKIYQMLNPFEAESWSYIFKYNNVELDLPMNSCEKIIKQHYLEAKKAMDSEKFSFFFRRISNDNKLNLHDDYILKTTYEMLNSKDFVSLLNRLTKRNIGVIAQLYINLFDEGDFLTTHCDSGNNIGIAINITKKWNANFGGITHITNDNGDIINSLTPRFGLLFVFDSKKIKVPHFVSMVNLNSENKRMAIIARYD